MPLLENAHLVALRLVALRVSLYRMSQILLTLFSDDSRNYYTQLETDLFHEINACKRRLQQRQNELQRQIMKAKVFIVSTTNPKPNLEVQTFSSNPLFKPQSSPFTLSEIRYFALK